MVQRPGKFGVFLNKTQLKYVSIFIFTKQMDICCHKTLFSDLCKACSAPSMCSKREKNTVIKMDETGKIPNQEFTMTAVHSPTN